MCAIKKICAEQVVNLEHVYLRQGFNSQGKLVYFIETMDISLERHLSLSAFSFCKIYILLVGLFSFMCFIPKAVAMLGALLQHVCMYSK